MDQEQPTIPQPTDDTPVQSSQASPQQPANAVVPAKTKSKKLLIILIIVWLLAFPVAMSLSIVSRVAFNDDTTSSETSGTSLNSGVAPIDEPVEPIKSSPVRAGLNIVSLLFGIYGVVGWIPVVIVAVKQKR